MKEVGILLCHVILLCILSTWSTAGYMEIGQYIFKQLNVTALPLFAFNLICKQESSQGDPNLSFQI